MKDRFPFFVVVVCACLLMKLWQSLKHMRSEKAKIRILSIRRTLETSFLCFTLLLLLFLWGDQQSNWVYELVHSSSFRIIVTKLIQVGMRPMQQREDEEDEMNL